jgi:polyketide synthase PksL
MKLDCTGYISQHRVGDKVIVPGATFIEAALRAELDSGQGPSPVICLHKGYVLRPCHVGENQSQLHLYMDYSSAEQRCSISLEKKPSDEKAKTIFRADLSREPALEPFVVEMNDPLHQISGEDIYAYTRKVSIQYGPLFTRLHTVRVDDNRGTGQLKLLPEDFGGDFVIHPTLMDAAFHVCGAVVYSKNHPDFRPGVPARIQSMGIDTSVRVQPASQVRVECVMHDGLKLGDPSLLADLQLFCDDEIWVVIKGLKLARVDPQAF